MNGNSSVSKRCSPVAPVLWAFDVITALLLIAPILASFAKPVNLKPAVPFKVTLLLKGQTDYLADRYSERKESHQELSSRENQDKI